MELYREQMNDGHYFLHEHPAHASSWEESEVLDVANMDGVYQSVVDQCQYGMEDAETGQPIKKPTRFLTNSAYLSQELSTRCRGKGGDCSRRKGGNHIMCNGKRARLAAIYHFELCRAILVGFRKQLVSDGICTDGIMGMQMMDSAEDIDDIPLMHIGLSDAEVMKIKTNDEPMFKDDLTGQILCPLLVKEARRKELEYFKLKNVWLKVPVSEARRVTGRPPITVRWVDVNKGDDISPNIRSRLVAREIRQAGQEAIFAPTPPLESLRSVLSIGATDRPGEPKKIRSATSERRQQVSAVDISRAYFNAHTDPEDPAFTDLPEEDPDRAKGLCGKLLRHMYGTRRAADGWQTEYATAMISFGFRQGRASPCLFWHPERRLAVSVHGDDFTTTGEKRNIDWFEDLLESRYELKRGGRLGPGDDDKKELLVLNRILRYTQNGFEYEADPRQAEKLLEEFGLDNDCKQAATPGAKLLVHQLEQDSVLPEDQHSRFRGIAARANYLAADRPDCQYAAKEVCRAMAAPTRTAMEQLKRLCRYLVGAKRVVYRFDWQEAQTLDCYTDTDWSGCGRSRRSTSGGCVMHGRHTH